MCVELKSFRKQNWGRSANNKPGQNFVVLEYVQEQREGTVNDLYAVVEYIQVGER